MPLSEKAARERKEELAMCTIGHEAIKDPYMLGVHKWRGIRIDSDIRSRQAIWLWILAYMIRRPKEKISRKAYIVRRR